MDMLPSDITAAARAARERLAAVSRDAAQAPGRGGATPQAAMAEAAREAVFADALLSAMHARLRELRNVAK